MTEASLGSVWQRWHPKQSPFARFVVLGGLNTLFSQLVYFLLATYPWQWDYGVAFATAYGVSILSAYWLNSKFAFRVPFRWLGFVGTVISYGVHFSLSYLVLHLLIEVVHLPKALAALPAFCLTLPVNFLLNRFFLTRFSLSK